MTDEIIASGPDHGRRRTVLAAVGGGLAVALLAGGAVVVATSASASGSPTLTAEGATAPSGAPVPDREGPGGRGPGGAGHWGMGLGLALHGTFVTAKPGGGYQTVAMQRGAVTALSATSVTVKSDDGYSATYVINSSTKFGGGPKSTTTTAPTWLKIGAKVTVEATVTGSTNTAVRIGNQADRPMGHKDRMPPAGAPQPGFGGPGPSDSVSPKPSASASTKTS